MGWGLDGEKLKRPRAPGTVGAWGKGSISPHRRRRRRRPGVCCAILPLAQTSSVVARWPEHNQSPGARNEKPATPTFLTTAHLVFTSRCLGLP